MGNQHTDSIDDFFPPFQYIPPVPHDVTCIDPRLLQLEKSRTGHGQLNEEPERIENEGRLLNIKESAQRDPVEHERNLGTFQRTSAQTISQSTQGTKSHASSGQQAGHQRTYQACIPCRRRKVRCDLGSVDNPNDPPCLRCRREARECFFSALRRKNQDGSPTSADVDDDKEKPTTVIQYHQYEQAIQVASSSQNIAQAPEDAVVRPIKVSPEPVTVLLGEEITDTNNHRTHPLYTKGCDADGYFRCPFRIKENCVHAATKRKSTYDKFIDDHLKPFRCKTEACLELKFLSRATLLRHEREVHGMHGGDGRRHLCCYTGCERGLPGNGFPLRRNLFDHMKSAHGHEEGTLSPSNDPIDSRELGFIDEGQRLPPSAQISRGDVDKVSSFYDSGIGLSTPGKDPRRALPLEKENNYSPGKGSRALVDKRVIFGTGSEYKSEICAPRDTFLTQQQNFECPTLYEEDHANDALGQPANDGLRDEDIRSTYSGSTDGLPSQWQGLKSKLALRFARTLVSSLQESSDCGQVPLGSSVQVQQFLRQFSIMLKFQAVRAEEADARRFVRSQRKLISRFLSRPVANDGNHPDQPQGNKPLDLESIHAWLESIEPHEQHQVGAPLLSGRNPEVNAADEHAYRDGDSSIDTGSDTGSDFGLLEPEVADMERFLVETQCWDWLKARVEVHTRSKSWPFFCIDPIVQAFCRVPVSGPQKGYFNARFVVSWHPRTFLRTQFDNNNQWHLSNVIVLTGCRDTIQACTCSEYMRKMWPASGDHLLGVLEAYLLRGCSECTTGVLPNESNVTICPTTDNPDCLTVEAYSRVPCLIDIAEQLAWLGEALWASRQPGTACYRRASCILDSLERPEDSWTTFSWTTFSISYSTEILDYSLHQGHCWKELFSHPCIAYDFPARSRDNDETGMEMTFEVMATLGEIELATSFNDKFMLKGCSSAFYPTQRPGSSTVWHFVCRQDGSYLSYLEASLGCLETSDTLDISWLQSTRHFVGWTPDSFYKIGTKDLEYARIVQPATTNDGSNLVLKQLTFGFSHHIIASAAVARGKHHQGVFCDSTGPYKRMIRQAKMNRVVLYDTAECRAWLTDGATALLHLLCCKLATQYTPALSYKDVTQEFQYADTSDPHASETVLCNPHNLGLVLDESPDYTVKDEIQHLFSRVQELVKAHEKSSEDWQLRLTDRSRLEGYSFRNIVDDVSLLKPKMVHLQESSGDWIEVVRDTKAVVLMARGLGDLIAARRSTCSTWVTVPVGRDYLVARIGLLRDIAESEGCEEEFPFWLTQNTRWHKGDSIFEECQGTLRPRSHTCCTRTQEIRPSKRILGLKPPSLTEDDSQGAVIFGRNPRFPQLGSLSRPFWKPATSPQDLEQSAIQTTVHRAVVEGSPLHDSAAPNKSEERDGSSSSSTFDRTPPSTMLPSEMSSGAGGLEGLSDTQPTSSQSHSRGELDSTESCTEDLWASGVSMRPKRQASRSPEPVAVSLRRKRGCGHLREEQLETSQYTHSGVEIEDTVLEENFSPHHQGA